MPVGATELEVQDPCIHIFYWNFIIKYLIRIKKGNDKYLYLICHTFPESHVVPIAAPNPLT